MVTCRGQLTQRSTSFSRHYFWGTNACARSIPHHLATAKCNNYPGFTTHGTTGLYERTQLGDKGWEGSVSCGIQDGISPATPAPQGQRSCQRSGTAVRQDFARGPGVKVGNLMTGPCCRWCPRGGVRRTGAHFVVQLPGILGVPRIREGVGGRAVSPQ